MKSKLFFRTQALSAALLSTGGMYAAEIPAKPNVLIIYMDDMGWGQPDCYGGKLAPTPHMDALAEQGVRFTNGYVSSPVCSPSRVGLLTGRYQARTGHDGLCGKPGRELDLREVTLAQRLKDLGYVTGIVGKWHLGDTGPEFFPASRGFDVSYGSLSNVSEGGEPGQRFYRGLERVADPADYPVTTWVYRDEALKFIEGNRDKPWFLYFSLNNLHGPVCAIESYMARFADRPTKQEQSYAAMITEADDAIGDVMKKLRELELTENTLVFLISDNGASSSLGEMGGLRGRKWLVWEGGIRVAWMVSWPGQIPNGRVSDEPVIQLDVMPTVLAAAGAEVKPEWNLDGVNLLPLLEGKVEKLEPRTFYFRFGVQYAIRQDDWKLVKAGIDLPPMLFDLTKDPGEQNDLAAQYPERCSELQAQWDTWNAAMQPPRWEDRRWNGEGYEKPAKQAPKKARKKSPESEK